VVTFPGRPPTLPRVEGFVAGKVALVTGAASGIGLATAVAFGREGAQVLLCDLDAARGDAAVAEVEKAGGRARFLRADVTREEDVAAAVRGAVEAFGRLDCAVNNAGTTGAMGLVPDCSLEEWSRTLAVNLTGVFLCMKHEIPVMRDQGGGAIVNVASGAGLIPVPGLSAYCASKHGVLGLTKTAAQENARTGVRVNAVCPGVTDTPMLRASMDASPAVEKMILSSAVTGRLGRPEEIAEAAVWLCSDRASYVSGESMLVDGGTVGR
jgi:NAD(P)-dependent dehydrogenase (short-subunit alcohol dehydrogenase family)